MPSHKNSKRKQDYRHPQPQPPPAQPTAPLVQADTKAIDAVDRAETSRRQRQPTPQRGLAAWLRTRPALLQTWLPIFFNGLVVVVIISHAYYYKRQWQAMQETLKEIRISRELDSRAWLTMKDARMSSEINLEAPVFAQFIFINSGKTPALKVMTDLNFEARATPLPNPPPLHTTDMIASSGVIGPSVEEKGQIGILIKNQQILDQLNQDGPARLYVWGRTTYEDIFGKARHTDFCFFLVKRTTTLQACEYFNYAD